MTFGGSHAYYIVDSMYQIRPKTNKNTDETVYHHISASTSPQIQERPPKTGGLFHWRSTTGEEDEGWEAVATALGVS